MPRFCSETVEQARERVDAELRAFDIARLNAARRDVEGLTMRPHPGNRFVPEQPPSQGEKFSVEKLPDNAEARGDDQAEAGSHSDRKAFHTGGYKCADYDTSDYTIGEYKSVYDT